MDLMCRSWHGLWHVHAAAFHTRAIWQSAKRANMWWLLGVVSYFELNIKICSGLVTRYVVGQLAI
jgi:hypothetical protein